MKQAALPAQDEDRQSDPPIVHIVEHDDGAREHLVTTLQRSGVHVKICASPASFLTTWRRSLHGCLLLDIHFPGFNGLSFQADLHDLAITLPIILMSERAELPPCVRHLKPGTVQLLVKPVVDAALLERVSIACEKDLARVQSDRALAALVMRYKSLTPREKQVMEFVSEGLMNKQIAAALGLSVITIKVHRAAMMRKMRWRRLVHAVRGADKLKFHAAQIVGS